MELSVQELEAAINYWRDRRPACGNEFALSPEVNVLAKVYALMIFRRQDRIDMNALDAAVRVVLTDWLNHARPLSPS